MQTLSIDLETYSDQPLAKTGVYRYVESPNFEILLFAYSVDGDPVQQIDLACGEKICLLYTSRRRFVVPYSTNSYQSFVNGSLGC